MVQLICKTGSSSKKKIPKLLAILLLGIYPRLFKANSHKNLHTNVPDSTIFIGENWRSDRQQWIVDKQSLCYIQWNIFRHKTEWNELNEPWKYCAQWKKPAKVTYCMISLIWNVQNIQIHTDREYISGWWGPERGKMGLRDPGCFFQGDENHLKMWWWLHYSTNMLKTHWIIDFKRMNFMVCALYINRAI